MKKDHARWGPNISHYVNTYETRIHRAYEDYTGGKEITSIAHEGLAPLPLLETALAISENMHKGGFQHGENSIPVIMTAIRRYTELQEHGIFSYYYGFLCIRHLMRMVCIGTLMQNSVLEDFLDNLDPRDSPIRVTTELADRALDVMHHALITRDGMEIVRTLGMLSNENLNAFPMLGGLSFKDAEFLVTTLWNGRRSIITVGDRGLLPGLGVLLFVLCEMLTHNPNQRMFECWSEMQELMVRYYMVASGSERSILRQLTRFIDQTLLHAGRDVQYPRYQEDAREVIQTYSDMMFSPDDPDLAQIMLLDMAYVLFQFVHSLCTPRVEDSIPMAVCAGLERIWLECDRERHGFMPANRRGFTRQFTHFMFFRLRLIREGLRTKTGRMAFGEAIVGESNIISLAGRVLLMMTMDDREPDFWDTMVQGLEDLYELIAAVFSAGIPNNISGATASEWNKVWHHLLDIYNGNAPVKVPMLYIEKAIEMWQPLGPIRQDTELCAYPRCSVVFIENKSQDSRTNLVNAQM
ncbi:hypothetical protein RhiJN_05397 [Ceratobasidium sp. AG-Ba]|nr:hypothetical protein RhiJN_05397 [Ceratobasidium sp. AG-Ba]QRW06313.1 hypothetical protein RhiLY_05312 [Ceratobasidium sp. AG-Ba]